MKGELDQLLRKVEKWVEKYVDECLKGKNANYFHKVRL
jgi:hypothetical protein